MQELQLVGTCSVCILRNIDLDEINPVLRDSLKCLTFDMSRHNIQPTDPFPSEEDINLIFPDVDLQMKYYFPKSKAMLFFKSAFYEVNNMFYGTLDLKS